MVAKVIDLGGLRGNARASGSRINDAGQVGGFSGVNGLEFYRLAQCTMRYNRA
jgi:hypothetical protein